MATDASVRSAQESNNDFCVICTCLSMLLTTDKLHFRKFFWLFVAKKIMAIRRHSGLLSSAVSAQLFPPKKIFTRAPLMVIYKKTFSTLCCVSRPNGLQNKIFSLQTQYWQNQACSQVLRFGGAKYILWGKDFNIYHMFETNFSEHNKIWGAQKRFAGNCPRMPHRVCGSGRNRCRKVFHWGP